MLGAGESPVWLSKARQVLADHLTPASDESDGLSSLGVAFDSYAD